ncbi:MAG: STAS domain-containing protein [Planctomycetota bacterium]|nr:STAS domain-containing protein [Planctomycetota bacterium]
MPTDDTPATGSFTSESSFVRIAYAGGVLVARLVGPSIGTREATIISRELRGALDTAGDGLRTLVLDMRGVQMMASMGLGMCIDARNRASRSGARTIVYGLCPELGQLFRMMKVDRLYRIARNEAELSRALAA